MRVIFLCLSFLIVVHSEVVGQTKLIDSFLGIKFGTSQVSTLAAVKARGGEYLLTTKDKVIAFSNLSVAGHKAAFIGFRFHKNAFSSAAAFFDPGLEKVVEQFISLAFDLAGIYGEPVGLIDADDDSEEAQKMRSIGINPDNYSYSWTTKMPNKKDNMITLQIRGGQVKLEYSDQHLTEAHAAELIKDL